MVEVRGQALRRQGPRRRVAAPAGADRVGDAAAGPQRERARRRRRRRREATLASPLQGNVFKVLVEQGATVEEGALICIIEAMKMENEITAHKAGVVAELPISEGAAVVGRRHRSRSIESPD